MIRTLHMALIVLGLLVHPAIAQPTQPVTLRFDVRYGPFRPARLRLDIRETAQTYAATGEVRSRGLLGLLRPFYFDLRVEGQRAGDTLRPGTYRGNMDTGWRQVQVRMRYVDGLPEIQSIAPDEPRRPWSVNPADLAGTVDLMSALYRVARPQPRAGLCGWSLDTFDGRRHARIQLDAAPPDPDAGRVTCQAAYLRVAGYAPGDLADRRSYPFTLTYAEDPAGLWQLAQAVAQTPYGRVRLLRQD